MGRGPPSQLLGSSELRLLPPLLPAWGLSLSGRDLPDFRLQACVTACTFGLWFYLGLVSGIVASWGNDMSADVVVANSIHHGSCMQRDAKSLSNRAMKHDVSSQRTGAACKARI